MLISSLDIEIFRYEAIKCFRVSKLSFAWVEFQSDLYIMKKRPVVNPVLWLVIWIDDVHVLYLTLCEDNTNDANYKEKRLTADITPYARN